MFVIINNQNIFQGSYSDREIIPDTIDDINIKEVNEIPNIQNQIGKIGSYVWNPTTMSLDVIYNSRPLTDSEKLEQLQTAFDEFTLGV